MSIVNDDIILVILYPQIINLLNFIMKKGDTVRENNTGPVGHKVVENVSLTKMLKAGVELSRPMAGRNPPDRKNSIRKYLRVDLDLTAWKPA